jgi:hypothetical protein
MTALADTNGSARHAPSPLDLLGGPDLNLVREYPPSLRGVVGEVLVQLRVASGSLVMGTRPRAYMTTSPAVWRTLRETPASEVVEALRRVERDHPGFQMPGAGLDTHTRVENLLRRAESE